MKKSVSYSGTSSQMSCQFPNSFSKYSRGKYVDFLRRKAVFYLCISLSLSLLLWFLLSKTTRIPKPETIFQQPIWIDQRIWIDRMAPAVATAAEQAENLRQLGKTFFAKSKFGAAIDAYTEVRKNPITEIIFFLSFLSFSLSISFISSSSCCLFVFFFFWWVSSFLYWGFLGDYSLPKSGRLLDESGALLSEARVSETLFFFRPFGLDLLLLIEMGFLFLPFNVGFLQWLD